MNEAEKAAAEAAAAAAAEAAKGVSAATSDAKAAAGATDITHNIALPNGKVFQASQQDLIYLATVGAAKEFEQLNKKEEKKVETAANVSTSVAAAPTGSDAAIAELKAQFNELKAELSSEQAARRVEKRKSEIVATISDSLAGHAIISKDPELRKDIQASILITILNNPTLSTQQAVDQTLTTFEAFAKKYMEGKQTTRAATRGAPSGGGAAASGEAPPKAFTLADMKSGRIRNAVTEKLANARANGSFN